MATTEGPARPQDRHGRRHPFSNWMKRLANLKNSSPDTHQGGSSNKTATALKGKKSANAGTKNNPYPLSSISNRGDAPTGHLSFSEPSSSERRGQQTPSESDYDPQPPATGSKSHAPTLSTNGETTVSDAAHSKAGTTATAGGGISSSGGGEGSTFSSPAPSVRSLTTTLTTIQSGAPSAHLNAAHNTQGSVTHVHPGHAGNNQQSSIHFSHQFTDTPATAVPSHLAPAGHPTTYNTATANNLLTDNASILTLASSSKRRRRNSLDTNASVRALAPSSVFGGSRESLPLSLLSGNVDPSNASTTNASVPPTRPSLGGITSSERISVYSSSGVVASGSGTGGGDRGSYHANRQGGVNGAGDTGSVRSGLHGRNDSYAGSTGGGVSSPLASPGTISTSGRVSRRGSGWGEVTGDDDDGDDDGQENGGKEDNAPDLKVENEGKTYDHKTNES